MSKTIPCPHCGAIVYAYGEDDCWRCEKPISDPPKQVVKRKEKREEAR